MEVDVASAIEEILDRRKTVSINGLGSLMLENRSAKVSEDGTEIQPPSAILSFFDTQTQNKPLRKYLADKYDLTKDQSKKAINKFSESVVNALSNYGEVNIKGVAYIQRKGGQIRVQANDGFINKYYKNLPAVPLKSTATTNETPASKTDKKVIATAAATGLAATVAGQAAKDTPKGLSLIHI